MSDPFRCMECGAANPAATACRECGATAFELARPLVTRALDEPPAAELVSLEAVRARRRARSQDDVED